MKVLIFATKFHPFKGGLENFVKELSSRLSDKVTQVDIVTFKLKKEWPSVEKVGNVRVYRLDCWQVLPGVYSLPQKTQWNKDLLALLERAEYDCVITNTRFFYSSYMGAGFAQKNRIRHIHIEHGNVFPKVKNPLVWLANRVYEYTLGAYVIKNADVCVGISQACVDFCVRMGAKPERTVLLHNSVDVKEFCPVKQGHTVFAGKLFVAFVGRLIQGKGVQDLIEAVKGLPVKLMIVGDGDYADELKRLADGAGIEYMFYGEQPVEGVKEVLGYADVFVNPSYSEGLPTSVLEAGSMAVPVIATRVGGTGEIIAGEGMGWLVEPKDVDGLRCAIEEVIGDLSGARDKGWCLRERVLEKFSWDDNVDRFVKLVEGVAE